MNPKLRAAVATSALVIAISAGSTAFTQKPGGILRTYDPDSPGGLSILEEATVFARGPMGGVVNNLIMFDQHVPQNSLIDRPRFSDRLVMGRGGDHPDL